MARQSFFWGLGLGIGAMYFFDPVAGRRRRKMVYQKAIGLVHRADHAAGVVSRDLRQRAQGLFAEARSLFSEEQVSDEKLCERVRSKLGRHVSHPSSIEVSARNGHVTLRGPVLEEEAPGLLAAVEMLSGVEGIDNQLEVHREPGDVPGLQGGSARHGVRTALAQENWSPSARFLLGGLGMELMIRCARNFNLINGTLGTIGFGLFLRAVTNEPLDNLLSDLVERSEGRVGEAMPEKSMTVQSTGAMTVTQGPGEMTTQAGAQPR